jgi:hypothetical protein
MKNYKKFFILAVVALMTSSCRCDPEDDDQKQKEKENNIQKTFDQDSLKLR